MEKVNTLSTAELKQLLAEREKEERADREKAREAYEAEKNNAVASLYDEAKEIALLLGRFKEKCHVVLANHAERLKEYGGIRSNSKGGFSLLHTNGVTKVTRRRDTNPVWDERATKALELIKDFLMDKVKKRDRKTFTLLMGFLEKNKAGDLEYAKVMELLKHQELFDDERWTEGLSLIKESYSQNFKAYTYDFAKQDGNGKWQRVELNFSGV